LLVTKICSRVNNVNSDSLTSECTKRCVGIDWQRSLIYTIELPRLRHGRRRCRRTEKCNGPKCRTEKSSKGFFRHFSNGNGERLRRRDNNE
jgi:hypothetical protein